MTRRRARKSRRPTAVVVLVLILAAGAVVASRMLREYRFRARPHLQHRRAVQDVRRSPSRARRHAETITATLYFLRQTSEGPALIPVRRPVSARSPAREALEELLTGPVPAGCERPLPEGTRVRGVRAKNGVVFADFTAELVKGFRGGSSNEAALVYAVVNTLTSLPGVERAQILVEGRVVETIGGHLDVRSPLAYDGELVVR